MWYLRKALTPVLPFSMTREWNVLSVCVTCYFPNLEDLLEQTWSPCQLYNFNNNNNWMGVLLPSRRLSTLVFFTYSINNKFLKFQSTNSNWYFFPFGCEFIVLLLYFFLLSSLTLSQLKYLRLNCDCICHTHTHTRGEMSVCRLARRKVHSVMLLCHLVSKFNAGAL